jgi:hypothetical protein
MLTLKVLQKVSQQYGLDFLEVGRKSIQIDKKVDPTKVEILYFWCAEINYFSNSENIIVSLVKAKEWCKGALLISSIFEDDSLSTFPASTTFEAVELNAWTDKVADALHSINLLYTEDAVHYGSGVYSYSIVTATRKVNASFSYYGMSNNPQLEKLWDALLTTTYHLVTVYEDDDLRKFIDQKGVYSTFQSKNQESWE